VNFSSVQKFLVVHTTGIVMAL